MPLELLIRAGAKAKKSSFHAGMSMLPRARRNAIFAIYEFCRAVDDIADDVDRDRQSRSDELDGWRRDIDALYAGGDPGRAAGLPVGEFRLERDDFLAVIDGMAMDVERDIRWPEAAVLDLYCDRVASAVGRLCVQIFGIAGAEGAALAHHLGRALQLTNILRDIDEDASIGRVYLPLEALLQAEIAISTPGEVVAAPRIDEACRLVATEARDHFRHSHELLSVVRGGHRLSPLLMAIVYEDKLGRLERRGWSPEQRQEQIGKLGIGKVMLRAASAL